MTISNNQPNKGLAQQDYQDQDLNELSRIWSEEFYHILASQNIADDRAIDTKSLAKIFPLDYKHKFDPKDAIEDLVYLQKAFTGGKLAFHLIQVSNVDFQLKIYSPENALILSNILPLIENLGFKAIDEQSFVIKAGFFTSETFVYNFILSTPLPITQEFVELKANVEDALDKTSSGLLKSDSLSKLVVLSAFNWQQVKLLKALTRYLHQTGFAYGKGYVQLTLIKHSSYTELLMDLFEARFNPAIHSTDKATDIIGKMHKYLDSVDGSAEDKVLRTMLGVVEAIVRTNCYLVDQAGNPKSYLSFKFASHKVPGLPLPVPYAEIFVYANDFEGVHLRGGKVARGGIRWSDRSEDYRTEVLGLMKAQMTKNAVIVPVGSKGGFCVNFGSDNMTRQEYMDHVVACYKNFLRGMLDLTDNIIAGKIIQNKELVIYDEQDPYLVVAADKGTATFSDFANSVSAEYSFWLGDAFASGGSAGYDHKKMAITAKGAWISVQRHFEAMGIDVQKDHITVAGIGDMSGDVFGNGMLRSGAIKLVAAFNHMHIFIDPDPDPVVSFKERERLFNLPTSKWSDYNHELISKGGGVFERNAKFIPISEEMKALLDIETDKLTPDELIKAILKARVDLIWNGGIGTYYKASSENNVEIGDKTNDNVRCDAKNIRAKVIAEGGNIGLSQQARIEYSKYGGRINTDFIDNSAGVDCSDHEVNVKIALNQAMVNGKLTLQERNQLLVQMTKEVEHLVLLDNYKQTQAVTIAELSPALTLESFSQLIDSLEQEKLLDRKMEFLPSKTELLRRSANKECITRPELAVLLSYSKMSVGNAIADALLVDEKYFQLYLLDYFPPLMQERFREEILTHPLKREIIKTVVTNKIVNQLSGPIINTIERETGAQMCNIIRSYTIVCEIFNLDNLWQKVESLPNSIDHSIKIDMFTELEKIMRRGSSWFLRNVEHPINLTKTIDEFKEPAQRLRDKIRELLVGEARNKFDNRKAKYMEVGIDDNLADSIAILDSLISVFDIVSVAKQTGSNDLKVANLYFMTASHLNIDWLRKTAEKQMDESYWNRLAIQSIKDDLYDKQRRLLTALFKTKDGDNVDLEHWLSKNRQASGIFIDFVKQIKLQDNVDLHMVILANKKFEIFVRKI